MSYILTVVTEFEDFVRGAVITDVAKIEAVLGGDHAAHVIKVAAPDAPAPVAPAVATPEVAPA